MSVPCLYVFIRADPRRVTAAGAAAEGSRGATGIARRFLLRGCAEFWRKKCLEINKSREGPAGGEPAASAVLGPCPRLGASGLEAAAARSSPPPALSPARLSPRPFAGRRPRPHLRGLGFVPGWSSRSSGRQGPELELPGGSAARSGGSPGRGPCSLDAVAAGPPFSPQWPRPPAPGARGSACRPRRSPGPLAVAEHNSAEQSAAGAASPPRQHRSDEREGPRGRTAAPSEPGSPAPRPGSRGAAPPNSPPVPSPPRRLAGGGTRLASGAMAARSQASLQRRQQSSQEARHRQAVLLRKLQAKRLPLPASAASRAQGCQKARAGGAPALTSALRSAPFALSPQVLKYRTRCRELEQQLEAAGGSLAGRWEAREDHGLEKALLQLEEEQQRCEKLAEVNALLREDLDKASEVNSALKEDVGKLTADWMRAREELEMKAREWRNEHELYDSYLRGEQNRLLSLWGQVVTFHRHFLAMKTATDRYCHEPLSSPRADNKRSRKADALRIKAGHLEVSHLIKTVVCTSALAFFFFRDLSELKAEQMRLSGSILVNCSRISSGVQLCEAVTLGRPVRKDQAQQQVGQERSQQTWEVTCLQVEEDLEKKELQDRVMELSALLAQSQKQNEEKEKTMKALTDALEILVCFASVWEIAWCLLSSLGTERCGFLKEGMVMMRTVWEHQAHCQTIPCVFGTCGVSPGAGSGRGAADSSGVFLRGLHQCCACGCESLGTKVPWNALKEELSARQDSINFLQQQRREEEEKCRKLQQRLEQLEEECKMASSHQQHLQSLVEALSSDCANLEKTREELQQQLEVAEQEASRLRQSNAELPLKEDSAQGEKVEQQEAMERARRDQELLLKDLVALEGKHSLLQSELVVARETLEESHLQRDLLKQEKHELTVALEKAEQAVAELTGTQNKLRAKMADVRVTTANMSTVNEALALDKVQLNKLVLQLEQENEVLLGKVEEMERGKISDQEQLNLCKRRDEELCAEKAHLEQLLKEAEEQQEGLQLELGMLAEEKAETQEKLSQVYRQQELASSDLEQLRQESSRQGHALATVTKEKELLVHEKAALEVRLAALERDRQGLSEQLAEARSVRETLQCSLFEAQQHIFELEIARSQLETQVHAVTQAKEVTQGDSFMRFVSGDPPAQGRCCEKSSLSAVLLRSEGAGDSLPRLKFQWFKVSKVRTSVGVDSESCLLFAGEVKCLQCELEAERSCMKQERDTMAQQLLEAEQQYNSTLKLWQTDHDVEVKKLLQDLASEREGHRSKLQEMLQQWAKEKAEAEREHEKQLVDMEQKIATLQAQQEEEVSRVENAMQEVIMDITEKNQETESQREQIRDLEKQQEKLRIVVSKMRKELEERDQEIRSQQEQIRELEKQREGQRSAVSRMSKELEERAQEMKFQEGKIMTVCDQLERTLETIKEKDRLLDSQEQQARSYEEKTEEELAVLRRDLEYSSAVLKRKDLTIESQKGLIETLLKEQEDSEQQKEIVHHLEAALKEKEQEMLSLRKQCEACKAKEEKHEAEQANLQAARRIVKEREVQIGDLEEAISKLQQQKEEAAMQTKAILLKLECAESSLEARDEEIVSLQERVQDLQEQKELESKQAKSLEQDLARMSQTLKEKHLELLKQAEQMNMLQLCGESREAALTSCQQRVNVLEEAVRKRDEDRESLLQKLQRQEEELKTLQNLQLRLSEKNEELGHPREQEKLLEEALHERGRVTEAEGELKELEEEMRGLWEELQHVRQTVTEKDEEIKQQRDRVQYLEKTLRGREGERRRQSELLKQLTSGLRWKDGEDALRKQIQKLQNWQEEEAEKRRVLQERDSLLQRQKELSQQLAEERRAKGEELERVIAVWKRSESGEMEWKEKAQALTLALTESEAANGTLREEVAVLQRMVSERDKDRFHHQAIAEGEQLSWLSEKRLLSQRLEGLQRAVARLEVEKTELQQLNAELGRTLEQVERERRRLRRRCRGRSPPDACGSSLSDQHKVPAARQEESPVRGSGQLAELQNQVSLLQTQLAQEQKHKEDYIERCAKTNQELSHLHQELSCSLAAVVREPKAAVLEAEPRRLC
ncbi:LOW QUALITY PROTEIN: uncharacterized protein VSU04_011452 [Chlamydotis macqueenii]